MNESGEREAVTAWNEIPGAAEAQKEQRAGKSVEAKEKTALKKRFRTEALAARDILTLEQRKCYSDRIIKNLLSLPCYQEADALLTYISFRSEVDTFPLLEQAFADGKAVFAPKVLGKEMAFYRIFSKDDLVAGYQGILEPTGGQLFETRKDDQSSQRVLICLPGAAFDRSCHRIGYGGGFYDRYLGDAACPQMKYVTAALAFNCQIFEEIPWETHDIRPECIITETEIIKEKRNVRIFQ